MPASVDADQGVKRWAFQFFWSVCRVNPWSQSPDFPRHVSNAHEAELLALPSRGKFGKTRDQSESFWNNDLWLGCS